MEQIMLACVVFVGALVALGQAAHQPHLSLHDKIYAPPRPTALQAATAPRRSESGPEKHENCAGM